MRNVAIFKTAHYMGDGISFANVREKLIAQTFAFRSTLHKACDVHECETCWNNLRTVCNLRQNIKPRIRHAHVADIRLNGAKRIIRGLRSARLRERVEQCRFPNIRQTHNATFKTHTNSPDANSFRALIGGKSGLGNPLLKANHLPAMSAGQIF